MNSLSVQGPPIVSKSLLNHSSLQTTNKVLLKGLPVFRRCLLSVVVKGCVLGLSLRNTASKKRKCQIYQFIINLELPSYM